MDTLNRGKKTTSAQNAESTDLASHDAGKLEGRTEARVVRMHSNRNAFSRETLAQWSRWIHAERMDRQDVWLCLMAATFLHALLWFSISSLKKPLALPNGGQSAPWRVQLGDSLGDKNVVPADAPAQVQTEAAEKPQPRAAPRAASRQKKSPKKISPNFGAQERADAINPVLVPVAPETQPRSEPAPSSGEGEHAVQVAPPLIPKGARRFLPGGSSTYLEKQRSIGQTMGEGPIAGAIAETEVTPDPANRAVTSVKEYSLEHYYDNLERRFSDAWGSERTLPPGSTFDGVVGENIEYDIVINRDGTLRKIVNISALRKPWRRFDDVDRIVLDVFSNVFPMESIPSRVLKDPVVIRKRITYTGNRYSIF